MSAHSSAEVECRACAHRFPAEVVDGAHVSSYPELRDAILAGELHRFMCPRCGHHTVIEKAMAYTDFERHHWFAVAPPDGLRTRETWCEVADEGWWATMVEGCPPIVRDHIAPQMTRRVVFGLASLREKLVAFDAGLDDRALELCKLMVLTRGGQPPDPRAHLVLTRVDDAALQLTYARPGGSTALSVPRTWYVEAEAARAQSEAPLFAGLVVDYRAELMPSEAP